MEDGYRLQPQRAYQAYARDEEKEEHKGVTSWNEKMNIKRMRPNLPRISDTKTLRKNKKDGTPRSII